jgi:rare lipoprotein A
MMTLASRPFYFFTALIITALLAGCGSIAPRGGAASTAHSGGYYLNDGPGDNPPADLYQVPDAVPKVEPLKTGAMKPYTVLGQTYTPMTELTPYKVRGIASWYGRRYNGEKTASGEIYDMYGMTAAHPTLPIPSYARVTNLQNGKSVVVRINDRGPFLSDRLIDLSYTAAYKLGVLGGGKALVEVEAIIPGTDAPLNANVAVNDAPAPVTELPTPPATIVSTPAAAVVPAAVSVLIPSASAAEMKVDPPEATPAPQPAPPVVAITAETQGVFLQLGAFGSQDNADNYLAKLRTQLDNTLATSLHVYKKGDGLFRVHAGPYSSQAEAQQAADHLNQSLGIKAIVVTR